MDNMFALVFTFLQMEDVLFIFIFCCANPFFSIAVSIMSSYSLQYVGYFYFYCLEWTSTCLLIHIGFVNQHISSKNRKLIKLSSAIRKYFIARYLFTSVQAMKDENFVWATRWFPMHSTNQFGS